MRRSPMRVRRLCACVTLLFASSVLFAQTPPPDRLPVKRVILYKNGIGYFEHLGKVSGDQTVAIEFTSAQLNDALKSLTVLDLSGGRITGISYNSEAPMSRRLGALRLPLEGDTTQTAFFQALRGARLEAQTRGGVVTGRLLSVERKTVAVGDNTIERDSLVLVSDGGLVRSVELDASTSVRLLEGDLTRQVGSYLDLVGAAREQDARRMTIAAAGRGERSLFVSYVSEVPIWKTTYRVVLPSKADAKPLLQGWAIVDNTVGEDWSDIELSLVAGAPQSFIQQLSQPYYARRPIVPLPEGALLTPQTHESGGEEEGVVGGVAGGVAGGVPGGMVGGVAETTAVDSVSSGPRVMSRALAMPKPMEVPPAPPAPPPAAMFEAAARVEAAASAQELGDLFEYKLKEHVTIRKNQSAMVPIVNSEVATEKVSLWSAQHGSSRPLRALWLTNSSALTLDGGSFTVLEGDAFAGEGLLDPMKPAERRLISYAVDLGVQVTADQGQRVRRVSRVSLVRGVMVQQSEDRARTVYTVRNDDTTARQVILEHALGNGWTLTGSAKPVETSGSLHRFRLTVEPKKSATLTVDAVRPGETRTTVTSIADDQIALMLKGAALDEAGRQAIRAIADKQAQIAGIVRDVSARTEEAARIESDQQRVRENMKALKGSEEEKQLVRRYARQLDEQESRLELLRKEAIELDAKRRAAQAELATLLQQASIDITLSDTGADTAR